MNGFAVPPVDPARCALFLDIDGTLLDLAPGPDLVVVPSALPSLLDSLGAGMEGAVALVSGRSLEAIARLFPGARDVIGSHGAEWRRGGESGTFAPPWSDALEAELDARAKRLPGILVERKPFSAALHYSGRPELADDVRALAGEIVRAALHPYRLLEGKAVVEIVPEGVGKGEAIRRFLQTPPYAGRRPVFAGDDVTDESGFQAVNDMDGVSIHVGAKPETAARYKLASPDALRRWLRKLDQSLRDSAGNEHA